MRVTYLTGDRVYLRAMVEDDKSSVVAWHDTVFPVNAVFAEEYLKDQHKEMWDVSDRLLAIARSENNAVVGGVALHFSGNRRAEIKLHLAPMTERAGELRAEALRLLVPWLLEEHNMRRVDIVLAADEEATITAARGLGMFEGVRLRQFFYKHGQRVDALIFQILNPNEEHKHA